MSDLRHDDHMSLDLYPLILWDGVCNLWCRYNVAVKCATITPGWFYFVSILVSFSNCIMFSYHEIV